MSQLVAFCILLNNQPVAVEARLDQSLAIFFKVLRKDPDAMKFIPSKVSFADCEFYRLRNPVPLGEDDTNYISDEVKQACLEETNRKLVHPLKTKVQKLSEQFSDDHIYLVIDIPDPLEAANQAVLKLKQEHETLFACLQATVKKLGNWHPNDVETNLEGGILTDDDDRLPPEFKEIQETLEKQRVYQDDDSQGRDFQNARAYQTLFDRVFAPLRTEPHSVISDREYAAFYNVLRCFNMDVSKIATKDTSSALKASNFTVHFVQPPFFSDNDGSHNFAYHQEKSWGFPFFLQTASRPDAWTKVTPKSDWMVISPQYQIPFVISEVISQQQQTDRSRMLIQAIALARAGQFLMKSTSKRRFFVVAVYVDAKMVASRYIVMQTGRDDAEHASVFYRDRAVCVYRKDFELQSKEAQVDFLREMYNLASQITALSGEFEDKKKGDLAAIRTVANPIQSLNSLSRQTRQSSSTHLDSIAEGSEMPDELQDEDGSGVFEAEDIQDILQKMDYKIEFILCGHPRLAAIINKTDDKQAYLKYVEQKRVKEVEVLQYLTDIESPSNHTITDVRFWPVQGGTVISMPVAGGWLTSLKRPDEQLWSASLQLIEAVAFMHEHNVAHMDLKPANIIIPPTGGRLSIIDFSVSIRVPKPNITYTGIVGTHDYMAPEVRDGRQYKPMLADLWSCGRTLEKLCSRCKSSPDLPRLLEIAKRLMDPDPEARPKMHTVLEWMDPAQRGDGNVVPPMLQCSPTVSAIYA